MTTLPILLERKTSTASFATVLGKETVLYLAKVKPDLRLSLWVPRRKCSWRERETMLSYGSSQQMVVNSGKMPQAHAMSHQSPARLMQGQSSARHCCHWIVVSLGVHSSERSETCGNRRRRYLPRAAHTLTDMRRHQGQGAQQEGRAGVGLRRRRLGHTVSHSRNRGVLLEADLEVHSALASSEQVESRWTLRSDQTTSINFVKETLRRQMLIDVFKNPVLLKVNSR